MQVIITVLSYDQENDPDVIEDIIKMISAFGEKKVKAAFDIAAKKRVDNPKRCYLYVKGIVEKIQSQQQKIN